MSTFWLGCGLFTIIGVGLLIAGIVILPTTRRDDG